MRSICFSAAAAMAAFAGHAAAQSSVSIYGIMDIGVEYQQLGAAGAKPATHNTLVASGSSAANRWGFRGTEDLGGGNSAYFVLEGGFNVDDGTMVPAGVLFNRRSVLGIKGAWGDLSAGRDYTPAFWTMAFTDYTRSGMYGGAGPVSQIVELGNVRQSNGLYYVTPTVNGFSGRAFWTTGKESTTAPTDEGRMIGISGNYLSGPFAAGVFYQRQRVVFPAGSTTSEAASYTGVSAQYDFGKFTMNGGYTRYSPAGPNTATTGTMNSGWLGLMVPVGADQVSLTLGRIVTNLAAADDGKTWLYGLNYIHPLSKRTSLYAGLGRSANNQFAKISLDTGQRAVNVQGLGGDVTAVMAGIRHTF